MPTDAQILNWVVQAGSFGLVVAIAFFLGKVVFPRFVKLLDDQNVRLVDMHTRYDAQLARRDESCNAMARAVEKMADQVERLEARLEKLEEKTDEHRPLPPQYPKPKTGPQRKSGYQPPEEGT